VQPSTLEREEGPATGGDAFVDMGLSVEVDPKVMQFTTGGKIHSIEGPGF
jgi:hypothetical protein